MHSQAKIPQPIVKPAVNPNISIQPKPLLSSSGWGFAACAKGEVVARERGVLSRAPGGGNVVTIAVVGGSVRGGGGEVVEVVAVLLTVLVVLFGASVLVMADGDTHAQWHSLVVYGPPGQATPHAQKKAFPNVWSTRPSGHAGE